MSDPQKGSFWLPLSLVFSGKLAGLQASFCSSISFLSIVCRQNLHYFQKQAYIWTFLILFEINSVPLGSSSEFSALMDCLSLWEKSLSNSSGHHTVVASGLRLPVIKPLPYKWAELRIISAPGSLTCHACSIASALQVGARWSKGAPNILAALIRNLTSELEKYWCPAFPVRYYVPLSRAEERKGSILLVTPSHGGACIKLSWGAGEEMGHDSKVPQILDILIKF